MQGPVDGSEVSRHDEIVPGAKTMTPLERWQEIFKVAKILKFIDISLDAVRFRCLFSPING